MRCRNGPRTNIDSFCSRNSYTHKVVYDCGLGLYHHPRTIEDKNVCNHSLEDRQYKDVRSFDMKMRENVALMMISLAEFTSISFSI
jgi:hypothetical protein